ncbi:hypothetical protein EDD18DRAFT_1156933 [Armillaria luteobubalina]|uniref:Uncharacterized protein n=1 Tax=Armillaria luteobubalina TaxID=153913 RepID=A0AA39UYG4_9AGAR|nr:hypothetical protein EDD18DRAFT_1156933 [Armillaria luteobubalina]
MAVASFQKPLSFAQKLYASALPPKYNDQQSSSQDSIESSRPTLTVHSENATSSSSSDARLPAPLRAQSYQTSPAPPRITESHRHQRASTFSAPSSTISPTDVRTVSLIARRPDPSGEFKGYSTPNPSATPSHPPQHNPSPPAPPTASSSSASCTFTSYDTSRPPIVHYPTAPSSAHSGASHTSPPTSAVNTSFPIPSPPHSSPSTITRFAQSPPETQRQLPHLPPTHPPAAGSYQGTPSLPPPPATVSDRSLLTDVGKIAGKAALKYAGHAALNSLTSGVLNGDALSGLSNIFQGLNVGDALGSFDFSQLQGIVQGQSGVDYQSIIDAITQQAPGVDYQSIINELANLQLNQSYQPAAQPAVDYQAQLQAITQQSQTNYQDAMNANMQQLQDIMGITQQQQQQTYNPMQDIIQMQQQQEQQSMQMLQALQQQQQQATQQMASALQQQQNPFSFSNSGGSSQQSAPPPHQSTHPYASQHSQHHNVPIGPSGHPYQHTSHGYGHHVQTVHPSGHHTGHRF